MLVGRGLSTMGAMSDPRWAMSAAHAWALVPRACVCNMRRGWRRQQNVPEQTLCGHPATDTLCTGSCRQLGALSMWRAHSFGLLVFLQHEGG